MSTSGARSLVRLLLSALLFCTPLLATEWGVELGTSFSAYSDNEEGLFLERTENGILTQSLTEIKGGRARSSVHLMPHYDTYAFLMRAQIYNPGVGDFKVRTGKEITVEEGSSANFTDMSDVTLMLRKRFFNYGSRPFFSFDVGYQFRRITQFTQFASQLEEVDVDLPERYLLVGAKFEPILANLGQMELTMPAQFHFGFGHNPHKAWLEEFFSRGKFRLHLALGARMQWEPRGFFALLELSADFFKAPFDVDGLKTAEVNQTEIVLSVGGGYFFKNNVYNKEWEE